MKASVVGVDVGGRVHPSGIVGLVVDDHVRDGAGDSVGQAPIYGAATQDAAELVRASYYRGETREESAMRIARTIARRELTAPDGTTVAPSAPRRTFAVAHIERRPVPEGYPELVAYLRGLLLHPALVVDGVRPIVIVDGTGLGGPACDMMRAAGIQRLRSVILTAGQRTAQVGRDYHVGASALVDTLSVKWSAGDIHIAPVPEAPALFAELGAVRAVTTPSGREKYESSGGDEDGEAHHGDLVSALSLAVWWAARMRLTRAALADYVGSKVRR